MIFKPHGYSVDCSACVKTMGKTVFDHNSGNILNSQPCKVGWLIDNVFLNPAHLNSEENNLKLLKR
jgi:hypothetical protein